MDHKFTGSLGVIITQGSHGRAQKAFSEVFNNFPKISKYFEVMILLRIFFIVSFKIFSLDSYLAAESGCLGKK